MASLVRAGVLALLGAACVVGSSSCGADAFSCAQAQACGAGGQCEAAGYCSFPDDACGSGRRYGEHAGGGLAGVCVPAGQDPDGSGDDGTGDGSATVDAATGGSAGSTVPASSGADGIGDDTLALSSGPVGTGAYEGTTTAVPPATTDDAGSSDGATGAPIERVTEGLLVLYRFDEGRGDTVLDQSGVAPSIDLTLEPEGVSPAWAPDGLAFTGGGIARALGSATKVRAGCQATGEITVEAWVTPSSLDQDGPTRIATLSPDISSRSFTLGQGLDSVGAASWVARLRTTTSLVNGTPGFYAPPVTTDTTHVLLSRAADGTLQIWADGELATTGVRDGDFSVWADTDAFAVGNEHDLLRPYLGVVHLVAVYDRALAPDEVAQNFAAGF